MFSNIYLVQYLVKKGADIELANRHGHTPLMIAAFKMRADIVRFLLNHGADPCRASIKGNFVINVVIMDLTRSFIASFIV